MAIADVSDRTLVDLLSFSGRVVVVTGGARGIGRAVARRFSEAGATVIVADIDGDAAEVAAVELRERGAQAEAVTIDVADPGSVAATADHAVEMFGGLDVWLNVAGIFPFHLVLDTADGDWERVIGVNLTGSFYGAREAIRRMVVSGRGGVVINFDSTAAHKIPSPGMAAYVASKGGIEALTRALAVEFGPQGIRVLAVSPTVTLTEGVMAQKAMMTEAFGNVGDPHVLFGQRLPLGRVAVPDDIARVALFLASDAAAIMTGSVIPADAGELVL